MQPPDPTYSALAGAVIGGVIGVIGTVLTAGFTSRRERTAFRRSTSLHQIDRVRDAYEHALNVLFNMASDGSPDRTTLGNLFAQVSLLGSAEVHDLLQSFINQPAPRAAPDLPKYIDAMKAHLAQLNSELK